MKAFCPFTVTVPASTANLGPGFDSLGMAVNLFLRMHVEPADRIEIDVTGLGAAEIAAEGKRLLTHIFEEVSRLRNEPLPPFRMTVKNEIPLARGLGSSASAVVGALVAADHLLGHPWSRDELFQLGTAIEGHPDNVAASLYGGLVVCTRDGDRPVALKLDPPDLPLVAAIPHHALKTKEARAVLPDGYSREDAVLSSSRSNLLVAALATGSLVCRDAGSVPSAVSGALGAWTG
jgi:homoserine kinase